MKKLLRIIIVFCFITLSFESFAQLKFGPKIGINFAKQKHVYDGKTDNDVKGIISFAIGGIVDYAFTDAFSIQPGLLLSGKGFKYTETEDGDTYKDWLKLNYLEIPINIVYKHDIGNMIIYGAAGPYFGFAIGGKWKYEYEEDGDSDSGSTDVKFGDGENDDGIKRGDFGLNIGTGVEINSFQIGINYGLGLSNISYSEKSIVKNNVFSISACYFFGEGH